jgi:hypothetical protein
VRGGANDLGLNVLSESGGKGQRDHERHHAGGDPEHGYARNHRNHGLFPFGLEVAKRDKKLKFHKQ